MRKRLCEYNLLIGSLRRGALNSITDVPGVKVGHKTLNDDPEETIRTGVTAIIPGDGDVYYSPVRAASKIINGFGKTCGLIQVEELGRIESPIVLTNTLSVGVAANALIKKVIAQHGDCLSYNPLVGECNDGKINDIRAQVVTEQDVLEALETAKSGKIETGSVGAGTGMICYGHKGGIGTSSRITTLDNQEYTIGALVLTNFGKMDELMIKGIKVPSMVQNNSNQGVEGSIMVILATDLPLSHRQLKRISERAAFAIARTGGRCHGTSGEVVIAFSTANRTSRADKTAIVPTLSLIESSEVMGPIFDATIDSVEEAILDSLFTAETTSGMNGITVHSLPVAKILNSFPALQNAEEI